MKNFLFILGLLISFMLFAPEEGTKSMDEVMSATKEAVMKEKNTADAQRRFEVLSNELKSSNSPQDFTNGKQHYRNTDMEKYGEIPSRHAFERSKSTS